MIPRRDPFGRFARRHPTRIRPCGCPDNGAHAHPACPELRMHAARPSGGPYCIARGCPVAPIHRAGSAGCMLRGY